MSLSVIDNLRSLLCTNIVLIVRATICWYYYRVFCLFCRFWQNSTRCATSCRSSNPSYSLAPAALDACLCPTMRSILPPSARVMTQRLEARACPPDSRQAHDVNHNPAQIMWMFPGPLSATRSGARTPCRWTLWRFQTLRATLTSKVGRRRYTCFSQARVDLSPKSCTLVHSTHTYNSIAECDGVSAVQQRPTVRRGIRGAQPISERVHETDSPSADCDRDTVCDFPRVDRKNGAA